jgi:arginine exporter protein ArgO
MNGKITFMPLCVAALSVTMSRLFHSTQAWIAFDSVIGIAMVLISLHLALG